VNDFSGKTLMHIKPHLIGKVLIGLKDDQGKRLFADFSRVAKSSQTTKTVKPIVMEAGSPPTGGRNRAKRRFLQKCRIFKAVWQMMRMSTLEPVSAGKQRHYPLPGIIPEQIFTRKHLHVGS